jgi:hypothetical protein
MKTLLIIHKMCRCFFFFFLFIFLLCHRKSRKIKKNSPRFESEQNKLIKTIPCADYHTSCPIFFKKKSAAIENRESAKFEYIERKTLHFYPRFRFERSLFFFLFKKFLLLWSPLNNQFWIWM